MTMAKPVDCSNSSRSSLAKVHRAAPVPVEADDERRAPVLVEADDERRALAVGRLPRLRVDGPAPLQPAVLDALAQPRWASRRRDGRGRQAEEQSSRKTAPARRPCCHGPAVAKGRQHATARRLRAPAVPQAAAAMICTTATSHTAAGPAAERCDRCDSDSSAACAALLPLRREAGPGG
jgi:hypothetical protein